MKNVRLTLALSIFAVLAFPGPAQAHTVGQTLGPTYLPVSKVCIKRSAYVANTSPTHLEGAGHVWLYSANVANQTCTPNLAPTTYTVSVALATEVVDSNGTLLRQCSLTLPDLRDNVNQGHIYDAIDQGLCAPNGVIVRFRLIWGVSANGRDLDAGNVYSENPSTGEHGHVM